MSVVEVALVEKLIAPAFQKLRLSGRQVHNGCSDPTTRS